MTFYFSGNAVDQNSVPVVGAKVYVYANGALANLIDADGDALANPLTTIADGFYEGRTNDRGAYKAEFFWGGKLRYVREFSQADEIEAYAATALTASGPNYASTVAGLAATTVGETFAVDEGDTIAVYSHDAGGVATFLRRFPQDWASDLSARPTSATLAANGGSSAVGFIQSGTGAVPRTAEAKLRETISVKDFGAVGDGLTDDTAAIQAAIDSGAKRIVGVAGDTYRITDTLVLNASNVELDFNQSAINLDDGTGLLSHLRVGDNTTQKSGIRLRNIIFTREQAATAGAAIDMQFVAVVEVSCCRIFGNSRIWRGINILRGIIVNVRNNYIDNYIDRGVYAIGAGLGANRTVDLTLYENRIEGGVTAFETYDFVEGVFCRDNIFFNTSGSCVVLNATSNANGLFSFKFQENDFDTAGGSGLFIDKVGNVQVTGCWFSSLTADALQIKSEAQAIIVAGNQFYPSAAGIRVESQDAVITGNLISGGTTGVNIVIGASQVSVTSNIILNCSSNAIDMNSVAGVTVNANTFANITGTPIVNESSGAFISDNSGDAARGTSGFISVGSSPFTYTCGPRAEFINVFGGTVSDISVGGTTISTVSGSSFLLPPNTNVTVTYSSTPLMTRVIQ